MRRICSFLLLSFLCACATPVLRLGPAYPAGADREYFLKAISDTTIELGAESERHHEELDARSRIEVLPSSGTGTRLRLTLTPVRRITDGKSDALPPEQKAEIVVGPDGRLLRIESVGGLPPEVSGARVEDIAPLLGAPLPSGRLRTGDRWSRRIPLPTDTPVGAPTPSPAPVAEENGRVAGLRIVHGYDCAIVELGTRRPIARDRAVGAQPLRFEGIEYSTSELAFAFRDGFPVRIETDSEARLGLTGAALSGKLTVVSHTVLDLEGANR